MDLRPMIRKAELLFFQSPLSRFFAELMRRKAQHLYERAIGDVGPLPKGSRIADFGCGHGTFLCMYLSRYRGVEGFGLDQSAQLVRFAQKQCRQQKVRAAWCVGDVHRAPLHLERFDVAVSHSSVYCWHDPVRALNRIHATLKPGGRFLLYDQLPARTVSSIRDALFVQQVYGFGIPAYTQKELCRFIGVSNFGSAKMTVDNLIICFQMRKAQPPAGGTCWQMPQGEKVFNHAGISD